MARNESIYEGKSLDDAVRKGLGDLGLTRAEAVVTIIEEGSGGFLGFGARPFRVRVVPRPGGAMREPDERGERDRGRGGRNGRDRDRGGRGGRDRDRGGRGGRGGQEQRAGGGREGRGGGGDRPRGERGDRGPRAEGGERPGRPERPDRPERSEARGERRDERGGRPPREERGGRDRDRDRAAPAEAPRAPQPAPPPAPQQPARAEVPGDDDGRRRRRRRRGGRGRGGAPGVPGAAETPAALGAADAFENEAGDEASFAEPEHVAAPAPVAESPRAYVHEEREPAPDASDHAAPREFAPRDRDRDRGRRRDRGDRGGRDRDRDHDREHREPTGPVMPVDELEREASRVTGELLTHMGYTAELTAKAEGTRVDVHATVPDGGDDLAGPKGEVRQALQHILNRMINRGGGSTYHLQLEVNDFWERREHELEDLAKALAEDAVRTQGEMVTEYLNSQERRIIHVTLKPDTRVKTYALGTGLIKRVAIAPADFPEPPPGDE